jgi:hypothetical protein
MNTSKNGTFLPWREDVPPCSPHRVEVVPLLRVLTRVGCVLGVVCLPYGGSMGGRGFLLVGDVTLASRRARSREGRAAHEACGGAKDLFANARYFSTVGFFPFAFGEALWRWQCSGSCCCAL